MISCTFDIERPAVMPSGASTGALGAVCPPVAPDFALGQCQASVLSPSYAIAVSADANGMGTDWAKRDRHMGIAATTRPARHLRTTPT